MEEGRWRGKVEIMVEVEEIDKKEGGKTGIGDGENWWKRGNEKVEKGEGRREKKRVVVEVEEVNMVKQQNGKGSKKEKLKW